MMCAMRQAERQLRIQEAFSHAEFVSLEELCHRLEASKATIRRDLIELERQGAVRRVYGGATASPMREEPLDFGRLSESCHDEKSRIGRAAADQIQEGQTVILGGGSTVTEVARCLFDRRIQVITNSIPVMQVFWDCRQTEITLTGGYLYPRLGIQLGPISERMLHSVSADVLVLGIRGVTERGLSDTNTLVMESTRAMIKSAQRVVIVADHTKFGRDAMIHVADLADVDQIISDKGMAPEHREMLAKYKKNCVLV
jgi:DeoR/GlpR family transcriptional regulator of sugar metabolism